MMSRIAAVACVLVGSVCVCALAVGVGWMVPADDPAEAADVGKPVCSERYYDLLQTCLLGGQDPYGCDKYLQWHFGGKCTASW